MSQELSYRSFGPSTARDIITETRLNDQVWIIPCLSVWLAALCGNLGGIAMVMVSHGTTHAIVSARS